MPQHNFKIIIFGYILTYWQFASVASANTEFSKTRDCTEIELEALINKDASRENNLARLSQQFFQSVNTIKHCDREQDNVDATPSADSDSASSGTDADGASRSAGAGLGAGAVPPAAKTETDRQLAFPEGPAPTAAGPCARCPARRDRRTRNTPGAARPTSTGGVLRTSW